MGGDGLAGRLAPRQRRTRADRGLAWFGAAAGVSGIHALASLYWALGGDWLINTVRWPHGLDGAGEHLIGWSHFSTTRGAQWSRSRRA